MSNPRSRLMSEEEIGAACELARRTLGRRLAGPWPPPGDTGELLLALAKAALMLCRHIEAVTHTEKEKSPPEERAEASEERCLN